jgi:hypothetical protein
VDHKHRVYCQIQCLQLSYECQSLWK